MSCVECLRVCMVIAVLASWVTSAERREETQSTVRDDSLQISLLHRNRRDIKRKIAIIRLAGQLYNEQKEDQNMAFQKISMMLADSVADEPDTQNNETVAASESRPVVTATNASAAITADVTAGTATNASATITADVTAETSTTDVSTTAAPYKASRSQLISILRKNLQGLSNLLQQEWRTAIQDSNKNSAAASLEFRNSVKPFITRNTTKTG